MINIKLIGHNYKYEISEFLRLFSSEFSFIDDSEVFDVDESNEIITNILQVEEYDEEIIIESITDVEHKEEIIYSKKVKESICKKKFAKSSKKTDNNIKSISKRIIQVSMFDYLNEKFNTNVPWGILTGIRPVKIIHSFFEKGKSEKEIRVFMKDKYLISDDKLDLIIDIANREKKFIYPILTDRVSLYVSIPFCPTRCVYCSFPSNSISGYGKYRHKYVETLLVEANGVNDILKSKGKTVESLYIGGGTPTALEADDIDYLIKGLFDIFDFNNIKEFTVEAGRPDTITKEKLEVLKKHGVDRISINPQTMNQITLDKIGRSHSVTDIEECFNLARKLGFNNINMDIILGLPNETCDMVKNTIDKILNLNPESVTVHTLALKRASNLKINIDEYKYDLTSYEQVKNMIEISRQKLLKNKYNPYYMYRQKYMLGNLENVGYAKEGFECIYNMQIMEERQSNYAIGAGAVSKFVYIDENRIERVDDVKNLEQYIDRVDEMIDKKFKEVMK